jgi:predicted RNA-binding protein associated with RNAse of E/G family
MPMSEEETISNALETFRSMIDDKIFALHQGDISEEQFHHAIDEGMNELESSTPFDDDNEQ